MKTLLLLLALAPLLLHAGDPGTNVTWQEAKGTWVWKGQVWKGQVHKYVDGRIWVTADRDNYRGTWLDAAALDPASRGWLGIGSEADDAAYEVKFRAVHEAERLKRLAAAIDADEAAKARLAMLQRQRDAAKAAKAADAAEKQRAFDNYLRILEVQALQRIANRR